jgi:competence protein ComEA
VPRRAFTVRPPRLRDRVVDRFHDWRSDARFGVVLLVVVAVVAGFVWYRVGAGGSGGAAPRRNGPSAATEAATTTTTAGVPVDATTASAAASRPGATDATSGKGAPARLAVHVAGAVTHPGVVQLPAGTRVIDAVEAVGGALPEADLDRLNLAAKVVDGERVFVPKVGQADPGVLAGDAAASSESGAPTAGGKLNLNTATEAQLEELPGIGPSYAQAILAERQRRGGFKSVNELRSVRGIGDKRFSQLEPLVTV